MTNLQKIGIGILGAVAIVAGYSASQLIKGKPDTSPISRPPILSTQHHTLLGETRPDFVLPDLENKLRHIAEWDGQALLINFWATWCAPCRKEIPAFIKARDRYHSQGFEIIGIALDLPDMVNEFAAETGINYPLLYGQQEATEVSQQYGNMLGALPYSVFVDATGKIQYIHASGELSEAELESILNKLLSPDKPTASIN